MDYAEPVIMHQITIRHGLPTPSRSKIQALQSYLSGFPQVDLQPKHFFTDGAYTRSLPIPADMIVVGKTHKHEHMVVLVKGTATINTDKGMETISAPHFWKSRPGDKRALYTHSDCEFATFHLNPTNTQDLAELEADIIEPEDTDMLAHQLSVAFKGES